MVPFDTACLSNLYNQEYANAFIRKIYKTQ